MIIPSEMGFIAPAPAGASFSVSAETQQFFDRLITMPSSDRQVLYDDLINALVADGSWALIDQLLIFAAADSGTSLVNLKQDAFPGQLLLSGGGPTFAVDTGWTGAGINGDISTNFNPSTAGGNYSQNSAALGIRIVSTVQHNLNSIPAPTTNIELYPKWSDNLTYWCINSSTGADHTATGATDTSGWFFMRRTSSSASAIYRNDVLMTGGSVSDTSSALANAIIEIGVTYQIAAWIVMSAPSDSQKTTIYTATSTYLTAVGAI